MTPREKYCGIRLVSLLLSLNFWWSNKKGSGRETSAVRHRQCRLYTQGHFGWQESFGRRRQRVDAWPRFRHLPLRHILLYHHRRCVHWPWNSSQDDRTRYRRRESIHYSSWWRAVSQRTTKRKLYLSFFMLFWVFIFKQTGVQCSQQDVGVHFQEVGREYGTTTGRRRRCGWLDLVVLKHSCLINGYDSLNLTKLDVLDQLSEIKVAIKYKIDGKELAGFPGKHLKNAQIIIVINLMMDLACSSTFSRLGCSWKSWSGIYHSSWMEILDRTNKVVWCIAGELQEIRWIYRRIFEGSYQMDWGWTG